MCEKCVSKEINLLKTIKAEVFNSTNRNDALAKINGWLSVLEALENARLGQRQPEVLQPLIPMQSG